MSYRVLKEERNYILQMIKKIRASGANVLLIQKSILRDAVTDLSLHYLVMLGVPSHHGNLNSLSICELGSSACIYPLQEEPGPRF